MYELKGGRWCAAYKCTNNSKQHPNISFFRFPLEKERCDMWIRNCQRLDLLGQTSKYCYENCKLCAVHFEDTMFLNDIKNRLHSHAVPRLFSWKSELLTTDFPVTCDETFENVCPSTSREGAICSMGTIVSPSSTNVIVHSSPDRITSKLCQTPKSLSCSTPRKNKLRRELVRTKYEVKKLENKINSSNHNSEDVQKFFTLCDRLFPPNMSKFLKVQVQLSKNKGKRYPMEFKQFSLMVFFLSPKAYRFLAKTFYLPNPRTLRRFTETWDIQPGLVNNFMLNVIKLRVNGMSEEARQCVLCIDEMALKCNLYYNITKDQIVGLHHVTETKEYRPAKSVMIMMIRGLHLNWKQPVSYVFVEHSCSGDELKSAIFNTIEKLGEIGLDVKAVVTDIGSNFYSFSRKMKISPEKSYFTINEKKIFYFFDTPHLIKAVRNNLFDSNFALHGKLIEKKYIEHFYHTEKSRQYKTALKLTDLHLYPTKFQRMKVKLATQVFSATVAAGMSLHMSVGVLPLAAQATIDFIDKIDKLFDIMNSSRKAEAKEYNRAFIGADYQVKFLHEMKTMLGDIQVLEKQTGKDITNIVRCLKCWQISITSLLHLHEALDNTIIYTRRINQDSLENFIGNIRSQGGHVVNPSPIQFTRAFKKLFCSSYFQYAETFNCAEDFDEILAHLSEIDENIPMLEVPVIVQPVTVTTSDYRTFELPETNALVYVCGYLLRKCLEKHSCEVCDVYARTETCLTESNIYTHFKAYVSAEQSIFGKLIVPPEHFVQHISTWDHIFVREFPNCALNHPALELKAHIFSVKFEHPCKQFPLDFLISLFTRMKIFYTIKNINRDFTCIRKIRQESSTASRNRKLLKVYHL